MILYLDTSAFVKLYVDEPGADVTRSSIARATAVYTHLITYAELRAALSRALRMGRQSAADTQQHKREFERDWSRIGVLMLDEVTIRRAGDLAERFDLRGYDSVHLAAAETLLIRSRPAVDFFFAAFDERLVDAAVALGFQSLGSV